MVLPALKNFDLEELAESSNLPAVREPADCEIRKRIDNAESVPAQVRTKAMERMRFVRLVLEQKERSGMSSEDACHAISANYAGSFPLLLTGGKGGSSQLTYNNYRHWLSLIGKDAEGSPRLDNLAALCDNYVRGEWNRDKWAGGEAFWQLFWSFYLNRNRLPATEAYRRAVGKIRKENPFAQVPSFNQAAYRIGQLDPATAMLARYGEEALKNKFIDFIRRDWSEVAPGMLLVSDNRQFDLPVRVYDEESKSWKAARPWICGMIDARSWYMTSWQITVDAIDCATIANALALHVHNNGNVPPLYIYMDNGKDFTAGGFSEPVDIEGHEHSIFKELGINSVKSLAYNAKAKTIERMFRDVMQSFDKLFAGYLGSRTAEKPETARYFYENPEQLPTVEQFCQLFGAWLKEYHETPKRGEIHQGKSPGEIWESRRAGTPLGDDRLFMAFLKPEPSTRNVHRGPAISLDNKEYYAQELWPHFGKKLMVKSDRNDDSHIYAFTPDGTLICECRTREKIKALGFDEENRGKISEAMAGQRRQIKKTYTAIDELTGGWHVLSPLELIAMKPGATIEKAGSMRSVKGASHKFESYRIAGEEKQTDQSDPTDRSDAAEPPVKMIEFKEDRKEEELKAFHESVIAAGEEKSADFAGGSELADFHRFIVSNKKQEEEE